MLEAIPEILTETLIIISFVALMMVLVEWVQINFKEKIERLLTSKTQNQIVGSSLLGALPGCFDAFFIVSLYTHGLVGFGALAAVMLATAGDEAFVMLAYAAENRISFEVVALVLGATALLGIIGGFAAEWIARKLRWEPCKSCMIEVHADEKKTDGHFLKEHVYRHIMLKHIPKLFIWIFFTLLAVHILTEDFDVEAMLPDNMIYVLVIAALIGIIPESGPHLVFLTLFADGFIPLSVFLTNALVQDGHGLMPLLSFSVRDTFRVKAFNAAFGLMVGLALFALGF